MKNRLKVIFFVEAFFNKRDYDRFGIEILTGNGFEVEVWDFTYFLTNSAYKEIAVADPIQWKNYCVFKDKGSAITAIDRLPASCYVVSMLHYNLETLAIYQKVTRKKIPYCVQTFALPISETKIKQKLTQKLRRFTFKKLLVHLFQVLPLRFFRVRPADLNLAVARKYLTDGFPIGRGTKILWTHNFDYDIYIKEQAKPLSNDKKIGVFLDEYLPFHPDFAYIGWEKPVDPQEYYPKLCRFFDYIEARMGLNIVIAAHPRSQYEKRPDFFEGRQVIRGKTGELVRRSEVVILHHSIAINFAILFKKPLIFVTSDKIIQSFNKGLLEDPSVFWLASFFGKKAYNLDHLEKIDFGQELSINDLAYKNYKDYYIKNKLSQDLPSWQIFADYLKKEYA